MTTDDQFIPAVLDREIESSEVDAFGHRHFAKMLKGLIESDRNHPPFSIGLLGKWGCGKSSIKSLYESDLKDDTSKGGSKKKRSERFVPITFNAWRFGGEDIKRALLRHVFLQLGGDKVKLDDALFRETQATADVKKGLKEFFWELYDRWGWGIVLVLLLYSIAVGGLVLAIKVFGLENEIVVGVLTGGSLLSPLVLLKMIFESSRFRISRYSNITRVEAPTSAAEQYEDLLLEQIREFKAHRGKACERLIIFVDDLDRLSSEEMVSGLDAVRTFMEIPDGTLPDGLGVVFVISCDEDRLADALAKRHNGRTDLPATVFTRSDARRYLDRIFQFRMEIPPFPKQDMRSFAEEHLRNALSQLPAQLEEHGTSLEALIDRMIHVQVGTPRNALQIINAFLQSWWVAQKRETDGAGTDRPGGLQEGAVTDHPVSLAVLSAMRVDFPDFYNDLQHDPELIRHFTDVFIRGEQIADKPEPVQGLLSKYTATSENGEETSELHSDHRSLRQFISSLRGIRWPKSIRPLLFLSQDPVTRKLGDKAHNIYQALISGDHIGILTELGRQHDNKPFTDDDVRFLHHLTEEVERESGPRKNDAATALAELAERYPPESAHLLLSRLARRLAESDELRSRLGVDNIGRVIGPASHDDKKAVACRLVNDLLKTDGEISFKLPSGESPSLEEALQFANTACGIVLSVRKDGVFPPIQEQRLKDWLLLRRVEIGEKNQSLPLSHLEEWMNEHEQWLLEFLGSQYSDLLADQFFSRDGKYVDINNAVRRCGLIFQSLLDSGEESRPELWRQLAKFVGVRPKELVSQASGIMTTHAGKPDGETITNFVDTYCARISKSFENSGEWKLNIPEESGRCQTVLKQRLSDINESASDSLQSAVLSLSTDTDSAKFGVQLFESAYGTFTEMDDSVIAEWKGSLLTNLPEACVEWLGRNCAKVLTPEHFQEVVSRLDTIHSRDNVPDDEAKRHKRIVQYMTAEALTSDPMQSHLTSLFTQLGNRHGNPNNYLYRVFPVVPTLLPHTPPSAVGTMLHTLFTNTHSDPALFGWLCHWMAGNWPEKTEGTGPYNPQTIFNQAKGITQSHPSTKWSYGALQTMNQLVQAKRVDESKRVEVATAACNVWPHHPTEVLPILSGTKPTSEDTASLVDSFASDEEMATHLIDTFKAVATDMPEDQQKETALIILQKPAKGTDENPDLCLKAWIDACSDSKKGILESLLLDDGLNDEQRKRVWLRIEEVHDELGTDFLMSVMPRLASVSDIPATASEMLEFAGSVSSTLTTADEKSAFGNSLVVSMKASSSKDAKNKIAALLKSLEVDSVLESFENPSDVDLEILKEHFGRTSAFKRLVKQKEKS